MANLTYKGSASPEPGTIGNTNISSTEYTTTSNFNANSASYYNGKILICNTSAIKYIPGEGWSTTVVFSDGGNAGEATCVFLDKFFISTSRNENVNYSSIYYSTDLNTWTASGDAYLNASTPRTQGGIAASSTQLLWVGGTGSLVTSTTLIQISNDGISWTDIKANFTSQSGINTPLTGAAYGNGKFVVSSLDGKITTSTDGVSWSSAIQLSNAFGASLKVKFAADNKFYAFGNSVSNSQYKNVFVSTDGISWTDISVTIIPENTSVIFTDVYVVGNKIYAYGGNVLYSSINSGSTWTAEISSLQNSNFASISVDRNTAYVVYRSTSETSNKVYKYTAINSYGVNAPSIPSTVAKNAPLKGVEFDSNLKSLDSNKVESTNYASGSMLYANSTGTFNTLLVGTTTQILTSAGTLPVWATLSGRTPADVQLFVTAGSSTWIKPTDAKTVRVIIIGGGGGGGGGFGSLGGYNAIAGSGGGGGGRVEFILAASSLPSTVSITVGAGGAGGLGKAWPGGVVSGNQGTNGSDSLFESYVAQGGTGGAACFSFGGGGSTQGHARNGLQLHSYAYNGTNLPKYTHIYNEIQYGLPRQLLGCGSYTTWSTSIGVASSVSSSYGGGNSYLGPGGGGGGGSWMGTSSETVKHAPGTSGGFGGLAILEASSYPPFGYSPYGSGGARGFGVGDAGQTSTTQAQIDALYVGGNGGGGGAGSGSTSISGGAGANGYRGGGGGGGGCSSTGAGGSGGAGGTGQVLVITYI